MKDGKPFLSSTVRQKWAADPIRGVEWKDILQRLDTRLDASPLAAPCPEGSAPLEVPDASATWDNEPNTMAKLLEECKPDEVVTVQGNASKSLIIIVGKQTDGTYGADAKVYLGAMAGIEVSNSDFFIGNGAGKMPPPKSQMAQGCNNTNSVICEWQTDKDMVVLEIENEGGRATDTPLEEIYTILKTMEANGIVDCNLLSHSCTRSTSALTEGNDRFAIEPSSEDAPRFKW